MVRINEQNVGDFDTSDNRIEAHAAETSVKALEAIGRISRETEDAMRYTLLRKAIRLPLFTTNSYYEADKFRKETKQQIKDKPKNLREKHDKLEAIACAARLSIPETELMKSRNKIQNKDLLKMFSSDGTSELNVQTASMIAQKYPAEISDALNQNIEDGVNTLSGRESILKTYQIYFEKEKNLAPSEARRAALELYSQNAIGRKQWKVAESVMEQTGQFGTRGEFLQWPGQQLHEMKNGSQESFVCHIAEAVGQQKSLVTRSVGPYDRTRRLGILWRRHNARPAWGIMEYPQLLASYYALRDAVLNGDLTNTRYIRAQRDEIVRLLLTKFPQFLEKDYDYSYLSDDKKKEEDKKHQQQRIEQAIRTVLSSKEPMGDTAEEIKATSQAALAFARTETGKLRRKILGTADRSADVAYNAFVRKPASVTYEYGVKKPVSFTGKAIAFPFRQIGRGLSAVWKKGNKKSKFF